jgi:Protein of unknown function (DUF1113).
MKTVFKYLTVLFIGGMTYYTIEHLWRGYSHWTMWFAGGLGIIAIGALNDNQFEWNMSLTSQMFLSGIAVTGIELCFGILFNMILKWHIWDYSMIPYNFLGQICMSYFGFWQILSPVAIFMYDYIDYWFFGGDKPSYKFI